MQAMRVIAGYKGVAERGRASETSAINAAANESFPAVLGAAAGPEKAEPTGEPVCLPAPQDGKDDGQSAKPSREDQNVAARDDAAGGSAGRAMMFASGEPDAVALSAAVPPRPAGENSVKDTRTAPIPQRGEEHRRTRRSANGLEMMAGIASPIVAGSPAAIAGAQHFAASPADDDGAAAGPIAALGSTSSAAEGQGADAFDTRQAKDGNSPTLPDTIAADAQHLKDSGTPPSPDTVAADAGAAARTSSERDAGAFMRTFVKGAVSEPRAEATFTASRPTPAGETSFPPMVVANPPAGSPVASAIGDAVAGPGVGGPAAPTASAVALGDLADSLSYHLVSLAGSRAHEVVLQVHPPALGDLTVRIVVDGRDVSAWFASPHVQVQQAISGAIGQLHTNLGNAGYNLNGAWVGADARGPSERDREPAAQPQQPGAANRPAAAEGAGLPLPSASSKVSVYV